MKRHIHSLVSAAALLGILGLVSGCESNGSTGEAARVDSASSRPMVRASAAENVVGQTSQSQLNFFDDLELRPLAAQDDAVHAVLLLGTGQSGQNYEHRVLLARKLGYVSPAFNRPGRQAVTVGEVAVMLSAVAEPKVARTPEQAVEWLVGAGVLAQKLPVFQGLTGAQMVSLVGQMQDKLQAMGVKRAQLPAIPAPKAVAGGERELLPELAANKATAGGRAASGRSEALPEVGKPVAPAGAATAASGKARGRSEPLPDVPAGSRGPAVELDAGRLKPAAVGPDGVILPATPGDGKSAKPAPKPAPTPKPDEKYPD